MEREANARSLFPIAVFVILYLGLGILFEYVLDIEMGFYKVSVVMVFLVALFVAIYQTKGLSLNEKFGIMGKGVGDPNILMMLVIFLTAGAFVGVVGREGAEAVAYCFLSFIPPELAVLAIFIVSMFVSLAMGTSVGTITMLTPISASLASVTGFDPALCIASTVGGAMFGDNLSFISDTTIAACNGQGCDMKDKFKENLWIALPAAILTCVIITVLSINSGIGTVEVKDFDIMKIVPYLVVLIGGIIGINVFVVLILGILSGAFIMLGTEAVAFSDMIVSMGNSINGMFETSMVAILVAAICALITYNGGFKAVLSWIRRRFKSKKGGMLGIGLLVGALDISTANNTVAIIMANPIAKEIADDYGISPKRTASLLDIFSCVFQGVIPYGAQMLLAVSLATAAGLSVSAFDIMPNLFYPFILLVVTLIYIFFFSGRKERQVA